MRGWLGLVALAGALFITTAEAGAAGGFNCSGPITVTANGTYPTANPIELLEYGNSVATWLKIVTAGSGTPNVVPVMWGPPATSNTQGTTNRAQANLCAGMTAATTYCQVQGHVYALSFTVTGCTGSCDLRLSVCGMSTGGN